MISFYGNLTTEVLGNENLSIPFKKTLKTFKCLLKIFKNAFLKFTFLI